MAKRSTKSTTSATPDPEATETNAETAGDVIDVTPVEATEPQAEPAPPEVEATEDTAEPDAVTEDVAESKPEPAKRGGFVPLMLGGAAAAALGFGAAYVGLGTAQGPDSDVMGQLEAQASDIAALQAELAAIPDAPAPVDLSGIEAQLSDAAADLAALTATVAALEDRVVAVETRPVLTGDADGDTASVIAALDEVQARLAAQEAENAAMAETMRQVAAETEASIAAAEDRAQASLTTAQAQATVSQLRAALSSGASFAGLLAELPETVDVPPLLADAAETGVPRLTDLQARFPAAARAALPVSLRETAGDPEAGGSGVGTFLRSQLGMRSITPREGDDPDAVLSRAQAAVNAGDIPAALEEIAALPDAGQAEMAEWIVAATTQVEALAALDALAAAVQNLN